MQEKYRIAAVAEHTMELLGLGPREWVDKRG